MRTLHELISHLPNSYTTPNEEAMVAQRSRSRFRGWHVMSSKLVPMKIRLAEGAMHVKYVEAQMSSR
ncbi:hypothetical protein TNCV_1175571 [Trichonephila clavipes]|nr:hypothetical protein TNCV_1175571 [Trichonephila clavipes]